MKHWLVKYAGVTQKDLIKQDFDELSRKVEETLVSKGITYSVKKFTDLAGNRRLRNRVIHEMYVPLDDEINEIKDETLGFVIYLDSLIT
jgi:hypothetical protein